MRLTECFRHWMEKGERETRKKRRKSFYKPFAIACDICGFYYFFFGFFFFARWNILLEIFVYKRRNADAWWWVKWGTCTDLSCNGVRCMFFAAFVHACNATNPMLIVSKQVKNAIRKRDLNVKFLLKGKSAQQFDGTNLCKKPTEKGEKKECRATTTERNFLILFDNNSNYKEF